MSVNHNFLVICQRETQGQVEPELEAQAKTQAEEVWRKIQQDAALRQPVTTTTSVNKPIEVIAILDIPDSPPSLDAPGSPLPPPIIPDSPTSLDANDAQRELHEVTQSNQMILNQIEQIYGSLMPKPQVVIPPPELVNPSRQGNVTRMPLEESTTPVILLSYPVLSNVVGQGLIFPIQKANFQVADPEDLAIPLPSFSDQFPNHKREYAKIAGEDDLQDRPNKAAKTTELQSPASNSKS